MSRSKLDDAWEEIEKRGWDGKEWHIGEVFAQWEEQMHNKLINRRVFCTAQQEEVVALKAEEKIEKEGWLWKEHGELL